LGCHATYGPVGIAGHELYQRFLSVLANAKGWHRWTILPALLLLPWPWCDWITSCPKRTATAGCSSPANPHRSDESAFHPPPLPPNCLLLKLRSPSCCT
jgi:hypothetical protein